MGTTSEQWTSAVEAFLADLVGLVDPLRTGGSGRGLAPDGVPPELADLPEAASRVLARLAETTSSVVPDYPSVDRALHEVIIAEVIADRLERRWADVVDLDVLVATTAATLDYFAELAATSVEGAPVTHGLVMAGGVPRDAAGAYAVEYPGRLPTRKRTPLLFDGTESALVVDLSGQVVRGVERSSLPVTGAAPASLEAFDELPGIEGGLTAAASAAFSGIGVYLHTNRSTWIFDRGTPLFVRRGLRWKSIAFESFATALAQLGDTSSAVGHRVARAALRLSMQGHGGILAIAGDLEELAAVTQLKDRAPSVATASTGDVDDDLLRLLRLPDIATAGGLARLARLDGATVIDATGTVVAYGAIVRSTESQGEGARSAAARALSVAAEVALSISHDGPITVYHRGRPLLELL